MQPEKPATTGRRTLRKVFSPTPGLKDIQKRANSQLLSVILLTMALCFAVVDITWSLSVKDYKAPWFGYVFLVSAFLINRLLSYEIAASLTCLMFPIVLFMDILMPGSPPSFQSLNYFAVAIILATILLSSAQAVAFTVGSIGFMALLPLIFPSRVPGYSVLLTPLTLNIICAVLAVVFRSHREGIERIRQNELRQSRDDYKLLVENMPDFVLRYDNRHRHLYASDNIEKFTGLSRERLLGRTMTEAGLPADQAGFFDNLLESVFTSARQRVVEFDWKSGKETLTLSAVCKPEADSSGKVISVLVVSRNITDKKRLEHRLRQSEKMDAVGQLAGGIAHDFNNQLAGIMGYADLIYAGLPDGAERSYADMIRQSASRAAGLTGQLLAFSRKGNPVRKPVDIHAIIIEVISLLKRSLDQRIELKSVLKAGQSVVPGDPSQIQNALLNLAINARDAIHSAGEIVFETSAAELDARFCREAGIESPPGPFLLVTLSDSGEGMTQETLTHIFEPFFTTKKENKGTGLGLSAVYGTVKNHHGAVTVYSEPGHGTIFKIYLPLMQGGDSVIGDEPPKDEGKGEGRILVVEDEKNLRSMLETILRRSGYEVACCSDGVEALELYSARWKETDLVVLDMVMPRMNGRETFLKMKEINPAVRAILSSGFSVNGEAGELLKAGIQGFVQKPYLINELLKTVRECLQGKHRPS